MFVGKYSHSVDDKGRFIMPAKYRDILDGRCVVTRGLDGNCLYIYAVDEWKEFAGRLRELPNSKPEVRMLQRFFFENAETVEMDKQGRTLISSELRKMAKITSGIVLVGMDNKIEVWNADDWNEMEKGKMNNFDPSAAAESLEFKL